MNAELHELHTQRMEDENHGAEEHDDSLGARIKRYIETFGPHLTDLWFRLYRTTILFCVMFVVGFFAAQPILAFFLRIFSVDHTTIVATTPFQFIDLSVNVGFFVAFFVTVPYFIWQLCVFVKPAVSFREFISMVLFLPLSFFLFLVGFLYGFAALYVGLQAMADLNISIGLQNYWDISAYIATVIMTSTLLGVLFQFPLVITLLSRMGMVARGALVRYRRVAYAIIIIFVAMLPPTDGLSLVIMSIPLIFLYEITAWLNRPKMLITRPRLRV